MREYIALDDKSSIEVHQTEEMGPVVQIGIVIGDDVIRELVWDNAALWEEISDDLDGYGSVPPAEIREAVMEATGKLHYRGVFTQLGVEDVTALINLLETGSSLIRARQEKAS